MKAVTVKTMTMKVFFQVGTSFQDGAHTSFKIVSGMRSQGLHSGRDLQRSQIALKLNCVFACDVYGLNLTSLR